jgi:hypothetical protein
MKNGEMVRSVFIKYQSSCEAVFSPFLTNRFLSIDSIDFNEVGPPRLLCISFEGLAHLASEKSNIDGTDKP